VGVSIKDYLEKKGLAIAIVGDNWNVDCPFCDDDRKRLGFKMSTGQWNCFNCEAKGSFRRFQKMMNEERFVDLEVKPPEKVKLAKIDQTLAKKYQDKMELDNRKAFSYLIKARGFSRATIEHFTLGSWKTKGYEYVSIPYWEGGKLVNMKFRAVNYTDKKYKWRRIKHGKSSLFHDEACDNKAFKEVFMCEAELDAVALWNAGIKNVVAATTGAKKFQDGWFDRLSRFKKIYLVYDSDVDGQTGAEKMSIRLGMDRCYNVKLPKESKDANNYFWDILQEKKAYTKNDFLKLVKDARRFEVKDTMSLQYALKEVYKDIYTNDEDELIGLQTPWKKLNKLIRGAKLGHLVVVTAKPKVGKTTWVLNWMYGLSDRYEVPTAMYCCEMRQKKLAKKIIGMTCKDFSTPEEISGEQVAETIYTSPSRIMHFGYPTKDTLELDNVAKWVKSVVARYGVKLVCFDNLHFLVRGDNVKDKVGEVTRRFKLLAETLGIVFVLIVHPRKIGNRLVEADDLKDSSSTYQDLDLLIRLHRSVEKRDRDQDDPDSVGAELLSPLMDIYVEGRDIEAGKTILYYQGQRGLFFEKGNLYERAVKKWIEKRKRDRPNRRGNYLRNSQRIG